LIASAEKGLYRQAGTILHRVDPRLKIFACLLLVAFSFSSSGWIQLAPVFATVVVAVWAVRPFSLQILRLLWMLRWLLLFTFLMHLFFSSGRTLWGLSWLSFDGLLQGTFVCLQASLAVAASALLGLTTSTLDLSLAFGWFVKHFGLLGLRTTEWPKIMLQALDFIPLVHAEINASAQSTVTPPDNYSVKSKHTRFHDWGNELHRLVFRLVDRGDEIAYRLTFDGDGPSGQQRLPVFLPMTLLDQLFVFTVCLLILAYWLVG
jgi:energy-coupling factor transport system permease protein